MGLMVFDGCLIAISGGVSGGVAISEIFELSTCSC